MKITSTLSAIFLSLFLTGIITTQGQNLVPNPGFETQDTCPQVSQINLAPPWNTATLGTPDLFNSTCSSQNLTAHTGIGCSGIYCLTNNPGWTDAREYIEAPLNSALTSGKTYYVSFWTRPESFMRDAMNRLGVYLSTTKINASTTDVLSYTPQVQNPSNNMLSNPNWIQISGSFVASGGESYILIGNFSPDSQTDSTIINNNSSYYSAYYYIDDIYVGTNPSGIDRISDLENQIQIYPTPATENVTIEIPSELSVNSIKLVNTIGQEVGTLTTNNNQSDKFMMNVEQYPAGIYFLSIKTSNGIITKQIMVTK